MMLHEIYAHIIMFLFQAQNLNTLLDLGALPEVPQMAD
jgi:hypothetical protein